MNRNKIKISITDTKIYENSKGQYHRIDGPAILWPDKYKSWYILDEPLEEKEFNSWISRIKMFI